MAMATQIKTDAGAYAKMYDRYVKLANGSAGKIKEGYVKVPNFIPRNLPAGYTQVACIIGTGTQYINSLIKPNQDTSVQMDVRITEAPSSFAAYFGARKMTAGVYFALMKANSTKNDLYWEYGTGYANTWVIDYTVRRKITTDGPTATVDGTSSTLPAATFSMDLDLYLLASNDDGVANAITPGEIYPCIIHQNGALARDYVPCINPSGTVGLYDMVSASFFGNAGTGTFMAGETYKEITRLFYQSTIDISTAVVTLASGTLTYNGSAQTKGIASVVVDGKTLVAGTDYTVTGNSATNAGSYTMTITGIGDYEGTITKNWSIAKATGSISVNPTTLDILGPVGTTAAATITYTGDGSISVKSSTTSKATVSRSGATITVKSVASGSATITITLAAGTNYTGASCAIAVTVQAFSTTLADNTWADIAAVAASGEAANYWSVGDTKTVALNGTNYTFRIIGFNHDNLNKADARYGDTTYNGDGKKAAITFEMAELFKTDYPMNSISLNGNDGNTGGWDTSYMRATVMPMMNGYMPTALKNVLRTVSKRASAGNKSTTITTSADQLFLLSKIEVTGTSTNVVSGEGSRYAYYKAGNSNVKTQSGTAKSWWTRSPASGNTTQFEYILSQVTDSTGGGSADDLYCVSFGFCI